MFRRPDSAWGVAGEEVCVWGLQWLVSGGEDGAAGCPWASRADVSSLWVWEWSAECLTFPWCSVVRWVRNPSSVIALRVSWQPVRSQGDMTLWYIVFQLEEVRPFPRLLFILLLVYSRLSCEWSYHGLCLRNTLQLSWVCSGVGIAQGPCLRSWSVFLGDGVVLSSPSVMRIGDVWEICCAKGRWAWCEKTSSQEDGWTAVAASGAQKPLAEVNCLSDDPFLLASCVKYNLQHLPLVAMSFHISLLLEYVPSGSKLTYSFYIIALGERLVKTDPCHFQATLFVWHWDSLLLAVCCLHKWLLEQETRQLWICASLCLPPLGSRLPVCCTCIIPADSALT